MEDFVNKLLETADLSWLTKKLVRQKYCEQVGRDLTHEEKQAVNRLVQEFVDKLAEEQKSSPDKLQVSPSNKENTDENIISLEKTKSANLTVQKSEPLSPRKTPQKNLAVVGRPIRQSPRNKISSPRRTVTSRIKRNISPRLKVEQVLSAVLNSDGDEVSDELSDVSSDVDTSEEVKAKEKERMREGIASLKAAREKKIQLSQEKKKTFRKIHTSNTNAENLTSNLKRKTGGGESSDSISLLSETDGDSCRNPLVKAAKRIVIEIDSEESKQTGSELESPVVSEIETPVVHISKAGTLINSGSDSPVKCDLSTRKKNNYSNISSDSSSLNLNKTPESYLRTKMKSKVKEKFTAIAKGERTLNKQNPSKRKAVVLSDSEEGDLVSPTVKRRKQKRVWHRLHSSDSEEDSSSSAFADSSLRKKKLKSKGSHVSPGSKSVKNIYSLDSKSSSTETELKSSYIRKRNVIRESNASRPGATSSISKSMKSDGCMSDKEVIVITSCSQSEADDTTPVKAGNKAKLAKASFKGKNLLDQKKTVKNTNFTNDDSFDSEDEPLSNVRRLNKENVNNSDKEQDNTLKCQSSNESEEETLSKRGQSAKKTKVDNIGKHNNTGVQVSDSSSDSDEDENDHVSFTKTRKIDNEDLSDSGLDSDDSEDIPLAKLNSSCDKNKRKVQTGTCITGTGNSTKKQGKPNGLESISEKRSNNQGHLRDGESQLKQLRKICRACGMFIRNDQDLKGCNTNRQKIQKLKMLLTAAGMKGRPSMKKADEVRLKKEAAELDSHNIISKESGRGKRKVDSKYLKRSATPSPRKPAKKPVKEHFSRLKGIIDSEGSDED